MTPINWVGKLEREDPKLGLLAQRLTLKNIVLIFQEFPCAFVFPVFWA